MMKNIACKNKDGEYAIQTVYFWDEENTWEDVNNGLCEVIEVTLHSTYRPSGKRMTVGERMFMPLGDYDDTNNKNKEYYDWACKILTEENKNYTTEIKTNKMGNPVVIHNKKEMIE